MSSVIAKDQPAGFSLSQYVTCLNGIVWREGPTDPDIAARFPVGTLLRILPYHACATAAQFPEYCALTGSGPEIWKRFYGW